MERGEEVVWMEWHFGRMQAIKHAHKCIAQIVQIRQINTYLW
jgi:hypothetical protein